MEFVKRVHRRFEENLTRWDLFPESQRDRLLELFRLSISEAADEVLTEMCESEP